MADEIRMNAPENVVESNATEIKAEAPKKERKPREKVRTPEECLDLPVTKLTDKEKNNLIKELKEALTQALNQAEAYKQNATAAYERARRTEAQYDDMEKFYREKLAYVDAQLNAFHAAINQAVKGGIA